MRSGPMTTARANHARFFDEAVRSGDEPTLHNMKELVALLLDAFSSPFVAIADSLALLTRQTLNPKRGTRVKMLSQAWPRSLIDRSTILEVLLA